MFFIIVWATMAFIITCLAYPYGWAFLVDEYMADENSDSDRAVAFFGMLGVNLFVWPVTALFGALSVIYVNTIKPWLPKVLRKMEK